LLILELEKGAIDPAFLTECQGEAMAGVYSEAMGAFVQWLARPASCLGGSQTAALSGRVSTPERA